MTKAFNLLDQPWIPLRHRDGGVQEYGLLDTFSRAQEFSAIAETSPPNLIALHRLLLAILHRALSSQYGPWRDADRARWFEQGLPENVVRDYLEQWRERFWLFHPETPFMQVAALEKTDETKEKFKPWTQIALEGANGSTPTVFDHACDNQPRFISSGDACRYLLGYLQFTPGGLVKTFRDSDKAGALANTAAVLPVGRHLAETLLLGLHPHSSATQHDLPAWERAAPSISALKAESVIPDGINDRYTRLTRAVLFRGEQDYSQIRELRFGAGLALGDNENAPDPMACYRINKDGKPIRVSFQEGRAVWRDLPSLLPDSSHKFDVPPAILGWAANLMAEMWREGEALQVLTAGLASDQAKLLRWRAERIELPPELVSDAQAASLLRQTLREGEDLYFRLRMICSDMIAATMPDPQHKDTRARARTIQQNGPATAAYFSTLEKALPTLLQGIAAGDENADIQWKVAQSQACTAAWDATCQTLGQLANALRAQAKALPRYQGLLNSLKSPVQKENNS